MTWEIAFVLGLLVLAVALFIWEKVSPDVTAILLLTILLVSGLLSPAKAFGVLSNPAPFTIGAMFILSAALVQVGAIDRLASALQGFAQFSYLTVTLLLTLGVGAVSAFVNNTPVVVIFVPVALGLAAKMNIPASKFLIPISYAAVLGGCCTLVGTSTNLLMSGIAVANGQPPLTMFELANVGVPMGIVGLIYIALFGWRILPTRSSMTSSVAGECEYLTEVFVQPGATAVGQTLKEAGFSEKRGVRVLEFIRHDVPMEFAADTKLAAGDRLYLSCRPHGIAHTRSLNGIDLASELKLPVATISAHEGMLVEGLVGPNSQLIGQTLREAQFLQRYRMVVLAVHRRGRDVREHIDRMRLQLGDVLLMMGTDQSLQALRNNPDLMLIDRPPTPARTSSLKLFSVLGSIAGVIVVSSLGLMPIEVASLVACVVVFLTGAIKPKDAYRAIEWDILFLIYGMLAVGLVMQETGTSEWIVDQLVTIVGAFAPVEHKPLIMLAAFYLTATVLTEILSNNAIAALMGPLAITLAQQLGVDPKPFLIAICIAASAAFATPIGYQTNTYVYGIGGYKFADFLKFGLPLNFLCFVVAIYLIPLFWPF